MRRSSTSSAIARKSKEIAQRGVEVAAIDGARAMLTREQAVLGSPCQGRAKVTL